MTGNRLRIARARSLDDVATGMCAPHEAIYEAPFGLRVLAGKSGSSTLLDAAPELVDRVFAAVERAADGFDVVVLDTGAGLGSLRAARSRAAATGSCSRMRARASAGEIPTLDSSSV